MVAPFISIDPGDQHCGLVYWENNQPVLIQEFQPEEMYRWLDGGRLAASHLVVEEYRLYPGLALQQGYSTMPTCEVIGVLKYLAGRWDIPIVMQPASIKKPTRARTNAGGKQLESVLQGKGGHCADAELHGIYYILTQPLD